MGKDSPTGSTRLGITPGERLFQRYLEEHKIQHEYHPALSGVSKHLDFTLGAGTRLVLCEVTDFGVGEQDKPILAGLQASLEEHESGIATATWFGALSFPDILQRIQSKVIAEVRQLDEFRGRHPLVVVLFNAASISTKLDDHFISCAACGLLTPELLTQLSAIAVVTSTRPGSEAERRALRRLRKAQGRHRLPGWRRPSKGELAQVHDALVGVRRDWGGALDEEYPALRVYHNPYATPRLVPSIFPAPRASHVRLVPHKHEVRDPETGAVLPVPVIYFTLQELPLLKP